MTCPFKVYLDSRTRYNINGMFPYYEQYISYCLNRFSLSNDHIFVSDISNSDIIICNMLYIDEYLRNGKKIVSYCMDEKDYKDHYDQNNVVVLDYTNKLKLKSAKLKIPNVTYQIKDILNLFPNSIRNKNPIFNVTLFSDCVKDIRYIIETWNEIISGNLYIFCINTIDTVLLKKDINSLNQRLNGKRIIVFSYDPFNIEDTISCLSNSLISIYLTRGLCLPNWSVLLRSFPILLNTDIYNKVFKYVNGLEEVSELMASFYFNQKDLQNELMELSKFAFKDFDYIQYIGA